MNNFSRIARKYFSENLSPFTEEGLVEFKKEPRMPIEVSDESVFKILQGKYSEAEAIIKKLNHYDTNLSQDDVYLCLDIIEHSLTSPLCPGLTYDNNCVKVNGKIVFNTDYAYINGKLMKRKDFTPELQQKIKESNYTRVLKLANIRIPADKHNKSEANLISGLVAALDMFMGGDSLAIIRSKIDLIRAREAFKTARSLYEILGFGSGPEDEFEKLDKNTATVLILILLGKVCGWSSFDKI